MTAYLVGCLAVSAVFAVMVAWLVSDPGRKAIVEVARELAEPALRQITGRRRPDRRRIEQLERNEELRRLRAERHSLLLELIALRAELAEMGRAVRERQDEQNGLRHG